MKRPAFHFTPLKGWTNDPNGTICINGTYHLFYQHYPDDIVWGPMHWGHAISKDLIHWEHLPIALYPDALGYIFSGCCILDEDNVTGLGDDSHKALIAIYTSHNPDTEEQQQSLAYSLDYQTFTKYEHNPIIFNLKTNQNYKVDFRDPKVFKNPILGGYSLVLAAGNNIEFYHSNNLLDWDYTGNFDPFVEGFGGIQECPDLIYINHKWVLTLSSILPEELENKENGYQINRVMQYFIGDFDGKAFKVTEHYNPLIVDYGLDDYAIISITGCDTPTLIGWGENWKYVNDTPENKYRGKMTLAKKVTLIDTPQGLRLSFEPIYTPDVKKNVKKGTIKEGQHLVLPDHNHPEIDIEVSAYEIKVTRITDTMACCIKDLPANQYHIYKAKRLFKGDVDYTIIKDESYYELYFEKGCIMMSIDMYH